MDARPDVLAEHVRAKRTAIDNDLELLRVRLQKVDPRRIDVAAWARAAMPGLAAAVAAGALWWWARRRRSYGTLEALLVKELSDLQATEARLLPALAQMSAQAANPDLRAALDQHRRETAWHADRLTRVFRAIGARPRRGASDAVDGVLDEAARVLGRKVAPDVRDAWLIASAQRAGHVRIANYGTARSFAATLGYQQAADLLQETLDEVRAADERLTGLATRFVNPQTIRSVRRA
jgi:ferritin-like metal-binding protein YciE